MIAAVKRGTAIGTKLARTAAISQPPAIVVLFPNKIDRKVVLLLFTKYNYSSSVITNNSNWKCVVRIPYFIKIQRFLQDILFTQTESVKRSIL